MPITTESLLKDIHVQMKLLRKEVAKFKILYSKLLKEAVIIHDKKLLDQVKKRF